MCTPTHGKRRNCQLFIFSSLIGFVFACGELKQDETDGGNAGDDAAIDACGEDDIPLSDLVACVRRAECEQHVRCLGDRYDDADQCVQSGGVHNRIESLETIYQRHIDAAMSSGAAVAYNGRNAARCLTAFRESHCDAGAATSATSASKLGLSPACLEIFSGEGISGAACQIDGQCAGVGAICDFESTTCDPDEQCCTGSCRAGIAAGADCSNRGDFCEPGLVCDLSNACNVPHSAGVGSRCSTDFHCVEAAYCDVPNTQCVADFKVDEAGCKADSQCEGTARCVGDDMGGEGTCRAVDVAGAPCDVATFGCTPPLWCDKPQTNELGSCKVLPQVGQNCNAVDRCAGAAYCRCDVSCVCTALEGEDGDCENSDQCSHDLMCDADTSGQATGKCIMPFESQVLCNEERHCRTGICAGADPNQECVDYDNCFD